MKVLVSLTIFALVAALVGLNLDIFKITSKGSPTFIAKKSSTESQSNLNVDLKAGEKLYLSNCRVCHQADGVGRLNGFPPLDGSEWVVGNVDRLVAMVLHGVDGEITVKGEVFKGTMPPFKSRLSPVQLAAILSYVRQAWSNQAEPVSVEQVQKIIRATKSRNKIWAGEKEINSINWK